MRTFFQGPVGLINQYAFRPLKIVMIFFLKKILHNYVFIRLLIFFIIGSGHICWTFGLQELLYLSYDSTISFIPREYCFMHNYYVL